MKMSSGTKGIKKMTKKTLKNRINETLGMLKSRTLSSNAKEPENTYAYWVGYLSSELENVAGWLDVLED